MNARARLIAELRQFAGDYESAPCDCSQCHTRIPELMVEAANLLAAEGWRDISVYPKDAEYRLLYSSAHGQVVGAHVTGDVWHLVGVGAITDASSRPTHWMPLPAPPGGTR